MLRNEGDRLTRVIVCTPREEYFEVRDLEAQNMNEVADPVRAVEQHDGLKALMKTFGAEVIDVPELADHPNSVFTRDVALCTPAGYVELRMGLPARRGEEGWMAGILDSLGVPEVGMIEPPGTVEGGDVILAGSVAFVGTSQRTNEEGAHQLSTILRTMDYEVRSLALGDSYLHLGGAMSAIGPDQLVCCADVFPPGFFDGFAVVQVPHRGQRPSVANVICLRENQVIANAAENMETIAILEANGVTVHRLDLSEFRKGAGGPTCMILPLQRVPEEGG
ncbi:MAG: amidinotransferase [Gemmatimonadetes bacterium]|nr:amidinotransferase [Gemmatimonadota bacterium]